ncbi:MAG: NUDIX hydrolase [Crocinitomicaceae bacterium]|nr:NUDIX hydrolase [Crocinitomicaceae bacterium]
MSKFNVRVYGLMFNDENQILVSDEVIRGQHFTKFPGGGLEFHESPIDCLVRECMEEMNQPIEVQDHFYTTEQMVRSAFRPNEQVISIYHIIKPIGDINFKTSGLKFDFDPTIVGDQESFRWTSLAELNPDDFSFLIDAHVVELIKKKYLS